MQLERPAVPRPPDTLDRLGRYVRQPILLMTVFAGGYLGYSVITAGTGGLGWLWALMGIGWGVLLWFAIGLARRDLHREDRTAADESVGAEGEPVADPTSDPGGPDPVR